MHTHSQANKGPMQASPRRRKLTKALACDDDARGFHRIKKGDEIKRYKFVTLLGQGVHGSVHSAYDSRTGSFVAIKLSRGISEEREGTRQEVWMQHYLLNQARNQVTICVAMLKGTFELGRHLCLVFDVFGKSLAQVLSENAYRPFPLHHVQEISRQLLEGVSFLHRNNVVHTYLKPDNILFLQDDYDEIDITMGELDDTCGLPCGLFDANVTDKPWRILRNTSVRIIDLGLAVYNTPGRVYNHTIQALDYRSPEASLGLSWTFPTDIHALGIILSELRFGPGILASDDDFQRVCALQAFVGPIPQRIVTEGAKTRPECFELRDEKEMLAWRKRMNEREYELFLKRREKFDKALSGNTKDVLFKALLLQMLDFDPVERVSARDALRHEYYSVP